MLCRDERLWVLIDDVIVPLPMQAGKPQRHDYHDERKGGCNLFLGFEPLTAHRFVEVTDSRTQGDDGAFMQKVEQR